jgi:ABC-type multidrug transport system fused ATPase/permease subunit
MPPPAASTWTRIVLPLLRPWRWWLVLAVALNALHGIGITAQTLVPKFLIDEVIGGGPGHGERFAWLIAAFLVASFVVRMLFWHLSYRIFTWVREAAVLDLRTRFFTHVNHLCLRFHGQHESGELFSYLFGSPLQRLQDAYQHFSLAVPGAILTLVSSVLWLGAWDLPLTGVLVLTAAVSVAFMTTSERAVQRLWEGYQKVEGEVNAGVADLLRGTRAVKLYAMEHNVAKGFRSRLERMRLLRYHLDVRGHLEWMKQESIGYLAFALLCGVGVWRHLGGAVSQGELVAYLACFFALQSPLQILYQALVQRGSARAALARIGEVLDTASSTPDPVGEPAPAPARGDIACRGVTFTYVGGPVLRDLDLTIPYGQKAALVGPSGSGKSTLAQLFLRLYDPDTGTISIGGIDLRRCAGPDLRRRFGVVPQDPFIFRTTIRENLAVARPEASEADLRRACEQANAWEFIAALPQGLDTMAGEGGTSLSGGQRQRLAIARALLADPPFFIFDEATSALDSLSEALIQEALERNLGDRTALFIAHRLATVRRCDRILVLREGRLEQDGTYAELVARPGLFRELVESQRLRG